MKKTLVMMLGFGAAIVGMAPAEARQGCGPGWHRGAYGHCRPNRGGVVVRPARPVIGLYYSGHGYWDGNRYWQHRYRWRNGWRYR